VHNSSYCFESATQGFVNLDTCIVVATIKRKRRGGRGGLLGVSAFTRFVTINGLYEAEVIHRRGPWRNLQAVEMATLEWVDWFNHRRLLEPIGHIPPAEAEVAYYQQLNESRMAA
jgi:transposase InsO family protein